MVSTRERPEETAQELPEPAPPVASLAADQGYIVLPVPAFVDQVAGRLEASFDAKLAGARTEITKEITTSRDELRTDIQALSEKTDARLDALSEKTDARFDALSEKTAARFDKVDSRFDALSAESRARDERHQRDMRDLEERMTSELIRLQWRIVVWVTAAAAAAAAIASAIVAAVT